MLEKAIVDTDVIDPVNLINRNYGEINNQLNLVQRNSVPHCCSLSLSDYVLVVVNNESGLVFCDVLFRLNVHLKRAFLDVVILVLTSRCKPSFRIFFGQGWLDNLS